ncbi:MAG: HTH domain-containing protein [bacterium]
MRTDTGERIVKILTEKGRVTAKELVDLLHISRQGLYLQIAKLRRAGQIAKIGKSPRVYYFIPDVREQKKEFVLDEKIVDFVNERYLYVSPLGEKLAGMEGFEEWCRKTGQEVGKTAREYMLTQQKYDKWISGGVISGLDKLKKTFPIVYLDKLYYLDFYSIERFGKTKLGQLLLYAKQSQSREIIAELVESVRGKVGLVINKHQIDGVEFVPPTVRREMQLMSELERGLRLPLRLIKIRKIRSELMVPQKTLKSLADRVENAAKTMVAENGGSYNNVLLIDDAVGSGATLNETAKQLRQQGVVQGKIIGLAIVGSYKGFDVISEV